MMSVFVLEAAFFKMYAMTMPLAFFKMYAMNMPFRNSFSLKKYKVTDAYF